MEIVSTIKANVKKKLAMLKANLLFKKEQLLQKNFFKIPTKLELLKIVGALLLDKLIKELSRPRKTKTEMKFFLQNDPIAKTIIKSTNEDLDTDQLSNIVLACYNELPEENIPEVDEEISAEQILNYADKINDIDTKINSKKSKKILDRIKSSINKITKTKEEAISVLNRVTSEYGGAVVTAIALKNALFSDTLKSTAQAEIEATKNDIKNQINQLNQEKEKIEAKINSYVYLVQHTIDSAKDLLTETDHPPKYRVKYVQKLTRQMYGILKIEYDETSSNVKKEINSLLNILKQVDNVIIAVAMITGIYITNRKNLQKKSSENVKSSALEISCTDFSSLEPFDVSINVAPFEITLNCPEVTDDVIVQHIPLSEKMKNLSCEVPQNEEKEVEAEESVDLITHAIIRNISQKTLTCIETKDSHLTTDKQIATLNEKPIYSPVEGDIELIEQKQIVLRDISDSEENYLEQQINLLNKTYERYNSVKMFLKNYYVQSLYPQMLSISVVDDASTRNVRSGIEKEWKAFKEIYELVNKEYEKQVKRITGKDNVEFNAQNETLGVIKDELDKEEEKFYKHLQLIHSSAENASKITRAKNNEFELFEYYSLDLGAMFNQLENTDKIETEFKDKINEFIRRRIIVDGYKKNKLANKINDQIKDIERGISTGNWFDNAMLIYSQTRKLDEVKKWLTGLAEKRKKLKGVEKEQAVNRVMFLFQLYLDYDNIVKKYNILQKETSPKNETIKEGNWIFLFTEQLWKDYKELPIQIEEIQNTIESLSTFQTYSIVEWNGYQARLYTIADEPICEWTEPDPYLNPASKFGFGDIQYWLKYCAFATLASCANPATGWSTGWITPTPIQFPVVYIPIKAIYTKYGFVVIGLSICGIYPFPWVLLVNFTTGYTTPFGDPTVLIKKQIEGLKKTISEQLLNLKRKAIKPILDKTKKEIAEKETQVEELKEEQRSYITNKPQRLFVDPDNVDKGIQENPNYVNEYYDWVNKNKDVSEKIVTTQVDLWKKETTATILQEAYTYGSSIKGVKGIDNKFEQMEILIGKQIDKLISMLSEIDNILAVLPIALAPETANFAITIKNPKPIIKIKDNLEDMIDATALNGVVDQFRLKSEDLTSSKYVNKLLFSVINDKVYRKALSAARMKIIIQDAFPKYENLTLTNYQWIMFLYKDFVTTGAKTYGFPGQMPMPM